MPTPFRLIAGYDGSEAAADMLDELSRAGLPDSVDATVLSVAERWRQHDEALALVEQLEAARRKACDDVVQPVAGANR